MDPDGMDIYRYDDKTGTFHLYQKNDDEIDQVGRFKYDKDTGTYMLKTKRDGSARTRIDNVEKGILKDEINLLTHSQVWSTNDITVEGFQEFIVNYSDMIGREMAGYYYTEIDCTDIAYIHSGRGKNNTLTISTSTPSIFDSHKDLFGTVEPHTSWHTHPSNVDNKLEPSPKDYLFKSNQTNNGVKRFIILTGGNPPVEY